MALSLICCVASLLALVHGNLVHHMEITDTDDAKIDVLVAPGVPHFSWSLCNTTVVPVAVTTLSISPDPIEFGKMMTITAGIDVQEDVGVGNTLQADLKLMMNIKGQFFDVCYYEPSYCHYEDVCSKAQPIPPSYCPDILKKQGINCKCPLKKNDYSMKDIQIMIPVPEISITGEFNVTVDIKEGDKPVACLNVHLCIGSC